MTTTPEEPLGDDDMRTTPAGDAGSAAETRTAPTADRLADGTDGGDADGTDGGDADGTDGDSTDTTDGDAS